MDLFNLIITKQYQKYTYIKNYKAKDTIFNCFESCEKIGFILKGEAQIITITHTEKEETISYLTKGSIFGDLLLFASENLYLGQCVCCADTTVLYINKANFQMLLNDKLILDAYLNDICDKAKQIKKVNKLLAHHNLEDRIVHYLLEEATYLKTDVVKIKNITSLAKILSIPRESLSRCLKNLIDKKMIVIKKIGQTCYIKLLVI